jgi:hypothetical protein
MKERTFPHIPKSSKSLEIGDFWSIPLNDGRFACGRVLGKWPDGWKGSLRGFFAGLLDWVSDSPPTTTTIAGAQTLEQGGAHIKTILATGGSILGNRPLEMDGISPKLFIEFPDNQTAYIFRGLEKVRIATEEESQTLPRVSIFGFRYLPNRANYLFCKKT